MRLAPASVVLAFTASLAAACGGTSSTPPPKALGDACYSATDCGDAMACVGFQCATACTSDAACGAGEFCARQPWVAPSVPAGCISATLRKCTDARCEDRGQICIGGYCRTPVLDAASCHPDEAGDDGCGADALCIDLGFGAPTCFHMPACAAGCGGAPPVGLCNDGRLSSKADICLAGFCLTAADCGSLPCLKASAGDALGHCLASKGPGMGFGASYRYVWETSLAGARMCPAGDSNLPGTHAAGELCASPQDCAPTCCDCSAGGAVLAAGCFAAACPAAADLCASVAGECGL